MPTSRDARTVTDKVLDILACFSHAHPALTLTEIAEKADLTLSTASRRTRELTVWGALERGIDGKFRIGMRLWTLASLAPLGHPLKAKAMPFLEDLTELTGGNAQLAIRSGLETLFIERLIGNRGVAPKISVANYFPITLTGVGLLLLAYAPTEVQEKALSNLPPAVTPKTITNSDRLRGMLQKTRHEGYAVSEGQLDLASFSVGAPVMDSTGRVVAAVGVVIHEKSVDKRHIIGTTTALARTLSRQLE